MATSPVPTIDPNVKSFLDLIAWSEGTSTSHLTANNGYDVIVSGINGPSVFTDYTDHPFANGQPPIQVNHAGLTSTASGRYQLLLHWWEAYKTKLNLTDFSPASQDAVAIQQIRERNGLTMIENGNVQGAIEACSNIWASLPGNDYGQAGGHTMQALLDQYNTLSGAQTDSSAPVNA